MPRPAARARTVARALPRVSPDYTSRDYWNGIIKMGLSKFFVLAVLRDGPMHGYAIAKAVERVTHGCCSPAEGTLYPVLREFEAAGYLRATSKTVQGRQRRVYALTAQGRRAFRVATEAWREATDALLRSDERGRPPRGTSDCC